jgi:ADP-heptose:LPS heptosyltransferase
MNNNVKKILVLRTEHVGDYIISIPLLKSIRVEYPKAKITLVVGPWNKQLAEATPYVDRIEVFDNPLVKRHISKLGIIKAMALETTKILKELIHLRQSRYNLLVIFSNRKLNKIFIPFVRADKKVYSWKLNICKNEKIRMAELLQNAGVKQIYSYAKINYSSKDRNVVSNILKNFKDNKKIVIHAITPLEEKNWGIENWASLISEMNKNHKNLEFFLIGSDEQEKVLEDLKKKVNSPNVTNLGGKINLIQTSLLIGKCSLFIGGDSGPMHLAEELTNTPIVALFGPTNEKVWGPCRKIDKIIKKEKTKDITAEEVLEVIKWKS